MTQMETLRIRREEILRELTGLGPMRRGSLVEQFVETTKADGSKGRRGPYVLYSYKERGKTLSRRVTKREEIPLYRDQIQTFRKYQELTCALLQVSEQMSDLGLLEPEEQEETTAMASLKKKPRSPLNPMRR
jgi:hypothetical protein